MRLRPVHHAVLGYLEWHCDRGIPFRDQTTMAADLARNYTEVHRAMRDLSAWGLVTVTHDELNTWYRIRLGDGRETPPIATRRGLRLATKIPVVHKGRDVADSVESQPMNVRTAA